MDSSITIYPNVLNDSCPSYLTNEFLIDIPVVCIKCKKYGHHAKECGKKEKVKKERTKMKQDKIDIKLVTIQDLMTEVKLVKQEIKEIKEDNSLDIDEQNIVEIVNLRDFPKLLTDSPITNIIITDPLDPPTDKDDTDINDSNNNKIDINHNRPNFFSLIDTVIFQKWYTKITLVIDKEFSLTEVALINSGANMNCIQQGLIPLKYYEKSSEILTQANGEKLIINYKIPNVHIYNDRICFETVFVLIKNLSSKVILGNPFMTLHYPFLTTDEGIKTNVLGKNILFNSFHPLSRKKFIPSIMSLS